MLTVKWIGLIVIVLALGAGCGCGDRWGSREIRLTEMRGTSSGPWGPIEVDTSQLPHDAVLKRMEKENSCGEPITELQIFPNQPIKIVIVPTTQPR
jgi:hypothetical protein